MNHLAEVQSKIRTTGIPEAIIYESITKLTQDYKEAWEFVKGFEELTCTIERGGSTPFNSARIEAKIAHFNQRRILAEFDIKFCNAKCGANG